jgi:uncharacterized membrane protein
MIESLAGIAPVLVVLGVWVLLQIVVLPRLGVGT